MIAAIIRTGFLGLRRDRGAFLLSFVLPIAFFSIFALVAGGMGANSTPRVRVLIVDEDRSAISERLIRGLCREPSLVAMARVGMNYFDRASGGLTPQQQQSIDSNLSAFRDQVQRGEQESNASAAQN